MPEPEYVEVPSMLPVALHEIEECVNRRRTEVPAEQALELAELVQFAKTAEQQQEQQQAEGAAPLAPHEIVVIVKPQFLVIDTNVFIDDLDTVLCVMRDSALTLAVPTPVVVELRGLRRRTASPSEGGGGRRDQAKQVSEAAVRSLQLLEKAAEQRPNLQLLLCDGTLRPFDLTFFERLDETVCFDLLLAESATAPPLAEQRPADHRRGPEPVGESVGPQSPRALRRGLGLPERAADHARPGDDVAGLGAPSAQPRHLHVRALGRLPEVNTAVRPSPSLSAGRLLLSKRVAWSSTAERTVQSVKSAARPFLYVCRGSVARS